MLLVRSAWRCSRAQAPDSAVLLPPQAPCMSKDKISIAGILVRQHMHELRAEELARSLQHPGKRPSKKDACKTVRWSCFCILAGRVGACSSCCQGDAAGLAGHCVRRVSAALLLLAVLVLQACCVVTMLHLCGAWRH